MKHILYTTADANKPSAICDANGEVVLDLCKVCGKDEVQLVDTDCEPKWLESTDALAAEITRSIGAALHPEETVDLGALTERSEAWLAVAAALDEHQPSWRTEGGFTGMDKAVAAIGKMAANVQRMKIILNSVYLPQSMADMPSFDSNLLRKVTETGQKTLAERMRGLKPIEDVPNPPGWQPIETAPTDNKRPLYLARFNDDGKLLELGFDGIWEYDSGDGWEHNNGGHYWQSSGALFECDQPTHWAYQDKPLPAAPVVAVEPVAEVPPLDVVTQIIHAGFARHGYRKGTKEGIAFYRGTQFEPSPPPAAIAVPEGMALVPRMPPDWALKRARGAYSNATVYDVLDVWVCIWNELAASQQNKDA